MTTDEALVFSGIRWGAARIRDRYTMPSIESVLRAARGGSNAPLEQPPTARTGKSARPRHTGQVPCTVFTVELPGGGRSWEATEPEAFWRNFAEIDFVGGDGTDVLRFAQRHGDPFGSAGHREFDTLGWIAPAIELHKAAQAWEPVDKNGVSYLTKDPARLQSAKHILRQELSGVIDQFTPIPEPIDGLQPVLRANTLHVFMVASATTALRRKDAMRRCEHCRDWFRVRRKDMRFCSDSCRSSAAVTIQKSR
jgi:hypothetical protein